MKLFGVNEFAARLPSALCGVVTLLILFSIGRRLYNDQTFALIWVAIWLGSFLPHLAFKTGTVEPVSNLFTFLGVYSMIRCHWDSRVGKSRAWKWIVWSGLFTGLAVLTTGPSAVAIVVLVLIGHWLLSGFRVSLSLLQIMAFLAIVFGLTSIWFLALYPVGSGPSTGDFISAQWQLYTMPVDGSDMFPGFHVVLLLIGCFPASVLAFGVIGVKPSHRATRADFAKWMHVLLVVTLATFFLVRNQALSSASLAYFPITFLAALTLYRAFRGRRFNRGLKISLGITAGACALLLLAIPLLLSQSEWPNVTDPFAQALLQAELKWPATTFVPGILFLLLAITTVSLWVRRLRKAWIYLFLTVMPLVVAASINVFVPKVEEYTQRPAMDFFKALEGKDVYVVYHLQPSYAPGFYSMAGAGSTTIATEDVLSGMIAKDVYIVSRADDADGLRGRMDIEEMHREGGFVFFRRPRPGIPL